MSMLTAKQYRPYVHKWRPLLLKATKMRTIMHMSKETRKQKKTFTYSVRTQIRNTFNALKTKHSELTGTAQSAQNDV